MSVFDEINSRLNIIDVAEHYGVYIQKNKKAFCPFHNDKTTPNLGFKDNMYKCFSCEASGDITDFVSRIYSKSQYEAAKILDADFKLGLFDEDYQVKSEYQSKVNKSDELLLENFNKWERKAFKTVLLYFKILQYYRTNFKPKSPDDELSECFVLSLHELDKTECILDTLISGDFDDKLEIYKSWKGWIDEKSKQIGED